MTLPVEKLVQLNNTLKNYSLEERARLYNLKPDRADVITNAADIFLLARRAYPSEAYRSCLPSAWSTVSSTVSTCNTTKPRKNKSPSPLLINTDNSKFFK